MKLHFPLKVSLFIQHKGSLFKAEKRSVSEIFIFLSKTTLKLLWSQNWWFKSCNCCSIFHLHVRFRASTGQNAILCVFVKCWWLILHFGAYANPIKCFLRPGFTDYCTKTQLQNFYSLIWVKVDHFFMENTTPAALPSAPLDTLASVVASSQKEKRRLLIQTNRSSPV